MKKAIIFLAEGHEEAEAMIPLDLMRRAGIEVTTASIEDSLTITSSHKVTVKADVLLKDADTDHADALVLPGGMPGTKREDACEALRSAVRKAHEEGRIVAAICAAPSVFGHMGIADGKKVTSYPGFDTELTKSEYLTDKVVVDGNMVTSRGMGTAIDFGLKLVELLLSKEDADRVAKAVVYR